MRHAGHRLDSLSADEPAPGFIPLIAIVELVWVLKTCVLLTLDPLVQALDALLPTQERVLIVPTRG